MDFLDPKKLRRNKLILLVGYVLIALGIGLTVYLLILIAVGYGLDKKGRIIVNGFVFVSSQPVSANISVNGNAYGSNTDTRMTLPSGSYNIKLTADGYRDWQHQITVLGKDVQHYDYPLLFPTTLKTKVITPIEKAPAFTSQSPDRRWLLVKPANATADFTQYDLKNPATPVVTTVIVPAEDFTASSGEESWQPVEWSSDNHHLLLQHTYTTVAGVTAHEYVMFDRDAPASTVNITRTVQLAENETLTLFNKKSTQFYAFDAPSGTLRTLSADNSLTPETLDHIVAFKSYGSDMLLYATSQPPTGKATDGKVSVVLQQGQKTYTLRTLQAGAATYGLDLAQYSGDLYALVGSNKEDGVYVYKNPQSSKTTSDALPAPWRLLKITDMSRVGFSSTAQFMMAESGQKFVVYDAENVRTYRYTTTQPLDAPQTYANWMDGSRLMYVSGGKVVVFDYDYQNVQTLQDGLPAYAPSFAPSYRSVFTVAPSTATPAALTSTPLTVTK